MNPINGATRCFAVLGSPIRHSLSPQMHNAAFRALGLNAVYVPFEVAPANLGAVLESMQWMGFGGVNLTIPLKEAAYALLPPERLDAEAQRFGAVNTVCMLSDGLYGHNTDGIGFLRDLAAQLDMTPRQQHVLVLGCGGAGRAIAITCAAQGAASIRLANRTQARAERVARDVRRCVPEAHVVVLPSDPCVWQSAARESDLIVQCSASGMRTEDPPLLTEQAFRTGHGVYDLVYGAPETPIMRCARAGGARVANGLGMLLHQGAAAFSLWTGQAPDLAVMRRTLETALYGSPRET